MMFVSWVQIIKFLFLLIQLFDLMKWYYNAHSQLFISANPTYEATIVI